MTWNLCAAASMTSLVFGAGGALAGQTIEESGTIACIMDKWDETEREKGHKIAQSSNRCVLIPDDPAASKVSEDCKGIYEYLPDGSWKASGTCTDNYPGGDTTTISWEEGSHLEEYTYTKTGGTGRYKGARGGGVYRYDNLTNTLSGGRYKGRIELP